jgi:glycosyltransferase involved in cell wall biosynthesis
MRIALVHYAYPPIVGGVERILEEHTRLFLQHGHRVTVLYQQGGEEVPAGARGVRLPRDEPVGTQAVALRAGLAGAEVVFVHNVMTMPFHQGLSLALEQMAAEMTSTRFVAWIHDVAACNPDLAPAPDWASRPHPGFIYVAVSELRRRQWRETSGAESRVVPNGLDPARVLGLAENLAAFAETHRLLDGRILLLHPTRLLRRKNVECSLRVAAELNRSGTPATLLITGAADPHNPVSAEYAAWLEAEKHRLGAEAHFLANHFSIDDPELAALYRLADALIFPSRQEGFGLPVLEAGLHRLPVFGSDIEAFAEWPEQAMHRFRLDEPPAQIAARVAATLETDPRRRWRRQVLTQFAWPVVFERHLAPLLER